MPGIEEGCSSPIPHLSKQRPPLSSCLGQKSFLDALSYHTCAQPACNASRSCLQNRCGIHGLLPAPPLLLSSSLPCLIPASTALPTKEHSNVAAEPVWAPKSGPGGPAAPATAQGRPGSPAASRAHGGSLYPLGTRQARASLRLCLASPDRLRVRFLTSGLRLDITSDALKINELTCEKHLEQSLVSELLVITVCSQRGLGA